MAHHWTAETDAEADVLYRTFSIPKIRRYQDLAQQQIAMAAEQENDDAVADLNAMFDALVRELLRRQEVSAARAIRAAVKGKRP